MKLKMRGKTKNKMKKMKTEKIEKGEKCKRIIFSELKKERKIRLLKLLIG